jgi:hypothetical protein
VIRRSAIVAPDLRPYRNLLRRGLLLGAAAFGAGVLPRCAYAQYVPGNFPTGVPGYDEEQGVTVVSRLRPLYEQRGIRIGDFIVKPSLDQSFGYNSNVLGLAGGRGSPVIETNPSVAVNSDWGRDSLGANVSVDNYRYPGSPAENATDWTAALGGGYTIGRDDLTLSYAHLKLHENPSTIGAPQTTTPIPFTVDDMRASYRLRLGRLDITPNVDVSLFRYGNATLAGSTSDQSFRDAREVRAGTAFRYALTDLTSLLFTVEGIDSHFPNRQPGAPSQSSTSVLAMGGIDYQYDGVWRYQMLLGAEMRHFESAQFKTQVAPIARAAVIWTPTEMTTVTATLLRTIEDPTQIGTSGYTYTTTALRIDHEYLRNVLLNAQAGIGRVAYLQNGGTQTAYYGGAGVTWLINHRMSLTAQYTYTTQTNLPGESSGAQAIGTVVTAGSRQHLLLVTVHFGL